MPNYDIPGIYVEEISTGPRPIAAAGTSIAAFVGIAPNRKAHLHEPFPVNNWTQFLTEFARDGEKELTECTHLAHAVFGFFNNGGTRCYVLNVGEAGDMAGDASGRKGIPALAQIDEVAIVAAPGFTDAGSYDAVLSHCEKLRDRVAILDAPETVPNIDLLKSVATASSGAERRPRGAAAAAAGAAATPPAEGAGGTGASGMRPRVSDGGFGAFYFPWLKVKNPLSPKETVTAPPSGHMAGIWARTDATRGVHKAPANEPVRGALELTYRVTRGEQGALNTMGVNCIRMFPREGIRVWGARTLDRAASEWRYLNVRRLFNMIEESIMEGTRWVVFEPNDRPLWKAIKRDVGAFLTLLWRDGALMGATPEEAFFVQCDEETNPPEVIDAGMVVTKIGIAPVKPAEFIVFRIGQHAGGAQVEA